MRHSLYDSDDALFLLSVGIVPEEQEETIPADDDETDAELDDTDEDHSEDDGQGERSSSADLWARLHRVAQFR